MVNEYGLMPEEIAIYKQFQDKHRACEPANREALWEEEAAPSFFSIELIESTIGMYPLAKCLVCGESEGISCAERINNA